VADRSLSVPVTLKGGHEGQNFMADLRNYARTGYRQMTKFLPR